MCVCVFVYGVYVFVCLYVFGVSVCVTMGFKYKEDRYYFQRVSFITD